MSFEFRGWTVFKTGPWGQGPVFLQQLALLDGLELGPFLGVEHVHAVVEGAKLAFADREAWYGDSAAVPLERLLSPAYATARRALSATEASGELRPGRGGGCLRADRRRGRPQASVSRPAATPATSTSPTASATSSRRRRAAAGCRARPRCRVSASAWARGRRCSGSRRACRRRWCGGRRPRTTLSPSLALRDDGTVLSFGTPGGDQQDQWSLEFFLAHAVYGLDLQAAIDAPMFHTAHFPSSFYPREAEPRRVEIEGRMPAETVAALRERGHEVVWSTTGRWAD